MHIVIVQALLPKYSIEFFNSIAKTGVSLTVISDLKSKHSLNQYSDVKCDFNMIHVAEKTFLGISVRPKLFKELSKLNFDRLILSGNPRDLSQMLVLLWQFMRRKPAYVWGMFHRIGGNRLISELYYRYAGFFSKGCLTYTNRGMNNQVMRGVSYNKIFQIGTAINERKIIAERKLRTFKEVNDFKVKNGLSGKFVVLQVVRLSAIKSPQILIEAAHIAIKTNPNLVFVLIGGGDLERSLKELVLELGLNDNFKFIGPLYDEEVLSLWFLCSNVFVVPTCIGLSAHHAMCYGLPIVTDDNYINQASEFEILTDGLNSLLYKSYCAEDLSRVILLLVNDPDYAEFIGNNGYITVSKIHTMENKVSNMLKSLVN